MYYWLKLYNDFFQRPAINFVLKQKCGEQILIIYQQLLLHAISTDGFFYYEGFCSTVEEEIAIALDYKTSAINNAIEVLKTAHLVEIAENGDIYLPELKTMVGKEADSTVRSRKSRERKKEKERLLAQEVNESQSDTVSENSGSNESQAENADPSVMSSDEESVVKSWNEVCVGRKIKPVSAVHANSNRKYKLSALCNKFGVDEIIDTIFKIPDSEYLCGNNSTGWTISFDWFIELDHFVKVQEGQYETKATYGEYDNISIVDQW